VDADLRIDCKLVILLVSIRIIYFLFSLNIKESTEKKAVNAKKRSKSCSDSVLSTLYLVSNSPPFKDGFIGN